MQNDSGPSVCSNVLPGRGRGLYPCLRRMWFPTAVLVSVLIPALSALPLAIGAAPLPGFLWPALGTVDGVGELAYRAIPWLLIGLACMAFGLLLGSIWKPRCLWIALQSIVLIGVVLGAWIASVPLTFQVRALALSRVALRAESIVDALEKHKQEKGVYPETLEALVPDYLARIPRTGAVAYPQFYYETAEPNSLFTHYELGVETPIGFIADRFFYWPEGDYPEHNGEGPIERMGDWAYLHE